MTFTFQPALWVLQQPHKHSHSLQLATHIEHITTFNMLYQLFRFVLLLLKDFIKVSHGHIKALKWHLKGPLATSK